MKKIFLMLMISFAICQIPIETKEYKFYKNREADEIDILNLINETDGLFKVEIIGIKHPAYDKIKKSLIVTCELEIDFLSGYSKNSIKYKVCKDKIETNGYLIIDKQNPNITFQHKYKYLEGQIILRISGEYRNAKISSDRSDNGILREWYDNDQLYLEFNMKNGIKNGICKKWYNNGQLEMIYNYNKGKLDGNQRKWFPNGKLRAEWNYLDDKLHGISTEWNEDGSIKSKKQYENGKLIKTL